MRILTIDTSGSSCAAALVCGGAVTRFCAEPMTRGHGERIFALVETVLSGEAAVDRIAVCTGPGSFTGVRIGVAAARGLALGTGVPAVGVTLLEAVAVDTSGAVVVALPAPGGGWATQMFVSGAAAGPATLSAAPPEGDGETMAVGPVDDARQAHALLAAVASRGPVLAPAPLYLRPADALPMRDAPAPLIA